jgi:hypothetical protein
MPYYVVAKGPARTNMRTVAIFNNLDDLAGFFEEMPGGLTLAEKDRLYRSNHSFLTKGQTLWEVTKIKNIINFDSDTPLDRRDYPELNARELEALALDVEIHISEMEEDALRRNASRGQNIHMSGMEEDALRRNASRNVSYRT